MARYTVNLHVQPDPLLLLRIAALLRKYDIALNRFERTPRSDGSEDIELTLRNNRDNMVVAMAKLERLVAVMKSEYTLIS